MVLNRRCRLLFGAALFDVGVIVKPEPLNSRHPTPSKTLAPWLKYGQSTHFAYVLVPSLR